MGRRLVFVLCALAALTALALASGATGSTAGSKYKIQASAAFGICASPCDPDSMVITMVGDNRTCVPFLDPSGRCNFWTGQAGTKVVLKSTADPPFANHRWFGDCTGTGDCKLTMDSNKSVLVIWNT